MIEKTLLTFYKLNNGELRVSDCKVFHIYSQIWRVCYARVRSWRGIIIISLLKETLFSGLKVSSS